MKKWIVIGMCLSLLSLVGCGKEQQSELNLKPAATMEAVKTASAEGEQKAPTQAAPSQETATQLDLSDFAKTNGHNQTGNVTVFQPQVQKAGTYQMQPLKRSLEEVFHIIRPEDTSEVRKIEENGRQRLNSESGMSLLVKNGRVDLSYQIEEREEEYNRFSEINTLLQKKAEKDPQQCKDLSFMTGQQAQERCEKVMKDLGLCFTPKLEACASMTHQEAVEYQQELLRTDAFYNPFGNAYELPELDENYDCYYLAYSFEFEGLSVYQSQNFPQISRMQNGELYFDAYAVFLISPRGIVDVEITDAFASADLQTQEQLIPGEKAAENASVYLDEYLTHRQSQNNSRVESVALNYVTAQQTDGTFTMVPYWGAIVGSQIDGKWDAGFTGSEIIMDGFTGNSIFEP